MDKLRRIQHNFISAALDGTMGYTVKPLAHIHQGRGITRDHFELYVSLLLETLRGFGIDVQKVQDRFSRVNTCADKITGFSDSVG
jgi:hemoglobin